MQKSYVLEIPFFFLPKCKDVISDAEIPIFLLCAWELMEFIF